MVGSEAAKRVQNVVKLGREKFHSYVGECLEQNSKPIAEPHQATTI